MMTGLLVGAWYTTFTSAVEKPMEYKKCLQQAQKNEEKGIYYDAILEYKKALEYDGDNRNIYMKIAEDYRNMGDDSGFVDACINNHKFRMPRRKSGSIAKKTSQEL